MKTEIEKFKEWATVNGPKAIIESDLHLSIFAQYLDQLVQSKPSVSESEIEKELYAYIGIPVDATKFTVMDKGECIKFVKHILSKLSLPKEAPQPDKTVEEKRAFLNIVEDRSKYLKLRHHSYEATRLMEAVMLISDLVPPEAFANKPKAD